GTADTDEISARLAASVLSALASTAALAAGHFLAVRFRIQVFPSPWGLSAACVSCTLVLTAVHLPFLAARGGRAGRAAAGAAFAATGLAAAFTILPAGSLYTAFLWLLYSGTAVWLYPPLVVGSALIAGLSAAVSWTLARAGALRS
ncbi:MAG TPA: hypothetical protein VLH39_06780, partial [Magnetospirillaceae bacterium]|nr:hypothetical protein [Magnetospirillaceae bacterium]